MVTDLHIHTYSSAGEKQILASSLTKEDLIQAQVTEAEFRQIIQTAWEHTSRASPAVHKFLDIILYGDQQQNYEDMVVYNKPGE